jgi:Protein of unknown function (DUF2934)
MTTDSDRVAGPVQTAGNGPEAASTSTGKTANRNPASRPAAPKTRKRRASTVANETSRDSRMGFTAQEWHDMVATAAYFRAESRGFENGSAQDDWFEAEAQLRERLARPKDEADDRDEANPDDHDRSAEAGR